MTQTPQTAEFSLPWPPSVNSAYRSITIGGAPRVLISRPGRAYKRDAAQAILAQRVPSFGTARVAVEITVYPPDRRARDLGNLDKLVMDALSPAVIADDSQIDFLVFDRRLWQVIPGGRLDIAVTELPAGVAAATQRPERRRTHPTPQVDLV